MDYNWMTLQPGTPLALMKVIQADGSGNYGKASAYMLLIDQNTEREKRFNELYRLAERSDDWLIQWMAAVEYKTIHHDAARRRDVRKVHETDEPRAGQLARI